MFILILIIGFALVALVGGVISSIKKSFGTKSKDTSDKEKNYISEKNIWWGSYEDYLDSYVWKKKRQAVMRRANEQCESEGCERRAVDVHHKRYPVRWGKETLDMLQAVCRSCHNEEHPEKPDMDSQGTDMDKVDEKLKDLLDEEVYKEHLGSD